MVTLEVRVFKVAAGGDGEAELGGIKRIFELDIIDGTYPGNLGLFAQVARRSIVLCVRIHLSQIGNGNIR